jgi:hypothetical protein
LLYIFLPSHVKTDPSCGSEIGIYNSTVDFGPRTEHAPVAYLSFVSPTLFYMRTTMHKIYSLKSERNVRIAGSATVYFYTISQGQKCVSHRDMDFPLHCSGVHRSYSSGQCFENASTRCFTYITWKLPVQSTFYEGCQFSEMSSLSLLSICRMKHWPIWCINHYSKESKLAYCFSATNFPVHTTTNISSVLHAKWNNSFMSVMQIIFLIRKYNAQNSLVRTSSLL